MESRDRLEETDNASHGYIKDEKFLYQLSPSQAETTSSKFERYFPLTDAKY
jgi:hypothetical protein